MEAKYKQLSIAAPRKAKAFWTRSWPWIKLSPTSLWAAMSATSILASILEKSCAQHSASTAEGRCSCIITSRRNALR